MTCFRILYIFTYITRMRGMIPKAYIMNSLKVVSQAHNNGEVPKESQENHDARNCSIPGNIAGLS